MPEKPPLGERESRGRIWRTLRKMQRSYRHTDPGDVSERRACARDFAVLVHYLHGGRKPSWFDELPD